MKIKKGLVIAVITLVLINIASFSYLFILNKNKEEVVEVEEIIVEEPIVEEEIIVEEEVIDNSELIAELKQEKAEIVSSIDSLTRRMAQGYDAYSGISSAYMGKVMFDSGLLNQPFVCCSDNNQYLRTNWMTGGHDEMGSIFMDYECNLSSQNIILYGHYVYPSYYVTDANGNRLDTTRLMFTPLARLTNYNNFVNNQIVYLVFQNDYRTYQVCAVYYIYLEGDDTNGYYISDPYLYYNLSEYSDDYFANYKEHIAAAQFYGTGVDYSNSDRFLTLQTCVEGNNLAREIVLCKQIGSGTIDRVSYNEYVSKLNEFNQKVDESGLSEEEIAEVKNS